MLNKQIAPYAGALVGLGGDRPYDWVLALERDSFAGIANDRAGG